MICYSAAEKRNLQQLMQRINFPALCQRAGQLRNNIACLALLPKDHGDFNGLNSRRGNFHVEIRFEDGVSWLVKFPHIINGEIIEQIKRPSREETNFDRVSELAIYHVLKGTNIPVAAIYDLALDEAEDNPVGLGYIMMQKLPGRRMEKSDWEQASHDQKTKILHQLRDMFLELEKLPCRLIGRPILSEDFRTVHVGPAYLDYDENGNIVPHGPFSLAPVWRDTVMKCNREMISNGEVVFQNRADDFLAYNFLCENTPSFHNPTSWSGSFFLKRHHTYSDDLLIDENYNITGITGWSGSYFAPTETAFQSPLFLADMLSSPDKTSQDEENFAKEFEEIGRTDIAHIIRGSKKLRCFEFFMNVPSPFLFTKPMFLLYFESVWRWITGSDAEFSWEAFKSHEARVRLATEVQAAIASQVPLEPDSICQGLGTLFQDDWICVPPENNSLDII